MRMKFKRILWPTDLSAISLRAAPYARALAESFDAELHLLHVAVPLAHSDWSLSVMTGGDRLMSLIDFVTPAKAELKNVVSRHFSDLRAVRSFVVIGTPWQEICQYAERESIDLIVIATHGLTGFKHLLIGSTAERVVQHAPCPVFTVKSFVRPFVIDDKQIAEQPRRLRKTTRKLASKT